jgi:hypothetical protein
MADPPASRVRAGITTKLNAFLDHHVLGIGPRPPQDVQANLQVCPQNAGPGQPADEPGESFTARTFDDLTPGALSLDFDGEQTTTSTAGDPGHGLAADPVVNQVQNGNRCPVHADRAGAGVATYESQPLPADATMIGGGTVTFSYAATGDAQALQLNARLYDLFPDRTAVMVDRGPRRIDPALDGARVTFQLHGNGWRFPAGHRVRLELMQDDEPYLKRSDVPSTMTLSSVHVELPVRETAFARRDAIPPRVRLRAARWASSLGRQATFTVRVAGSDIGGIRGYEAKVRELPGGRWRRATVRGTAVRVRGRAGRGYLVRVRAIDQSDNRGAYATARVTVPRDDRSLRGRGRRLRATSAWNGTLTRFSRLRAAFTGREVALIGPRPARDTVVTAHLDGRRRTLKIPGGRPGPRKVLAFLRARRTGRHTFTAHGPLVLDALGTR